MANEDKTVRGVVEATAQNKPDRFGLRLGGEWYDGFGPCPVQKGDEVELAFSIRGRFRNIHEVRLMTAGESVAVPENGGRVMRHEAERDSRIARAVALKCATKLHEGSAAKSADVLELAEKFEGWLRATPRHPHQNRGDLRG